MIPTRRIPLTGLTNFRDLGGYPAADGRQVRWRTIFRSDTLARLTDNDVETVAGLGIVAACDLRYGDERRSEPSRLLGHDRIEVLELGLDGRPGASFLDSFESFEDAAEAARRYLIDNYRRYPFMYAAAYRRIFERLLTGDRLVFHCTAGKDRAGFAAAVVLSALGVERDTIREDYLLTNRYWDRGGRERPGMDAATTAMIFSARDEYLDAAFSAIDREHGTVEAYLVERVGLRANDLKALRDLCLD